jgi:hypothetical protein
MCCAALLLRLTSFPLADMEAINDRLRYTGRFYLTDSERQQVINWLWDELGVNLDHPPQD